MKKCLSSLVLVPFLFVGCGSTSDTNVGKGFYVDAAVQGATYVCGNQQGKTDARGAFLFEKGKECTFSLNDKVFKEVDASHLKDGVIIQEEDTNVARFLMTLDNDGDASNGITILKESESVVDKIPRNDTEFTQLSTKLQTVGAYHGKLVTTDQAKEHLASSAAIVAKISASNSQAKYGDSVTYSATQSIINRGIIKEYLWKEGSTVLSHDPSFSKSDFSVGDHTLTLTLTDGDGNLYTSSFDFAIQPATRWTNVPVLDSNGPSKLYVTSDANQMFIKLASPDDLENVIFFIDSDDSHASGLQTASYDASGFDFSVKSSGLYKLLHHKDFADKMVQPFSYTIENGALEVALSKSQLGYVGENITVVAFFPDDTSKNIPTAAAGIKKYHDSHYDAMQADNDAPEITLSGENPVTLNVGASYSDVGAVAQDVREGSVNVSVDTSHVDTSKEGFYDVIYTAQDSKGNQASKARIVRVKGTPSQATLERKNLSGESVIINHQTGLVWADDNTLAVEGQGETRGCMIVGHEIPYADIESMFTGYCERSDYAGFTDWRTPTSLEMSKYTVRMDQEGKIPGMARRGCSRTLGVDNGTVKAIWTHNFPKPNKQPGFIETATLTPSGGRCVRGPVDTNTGEFSINEVGATKDRVIVDSSKNLMWVNAYDKSKHACLAIHTDKPAEYDTSKGFCEALNHAGFTNWRAPSAAELTNFVKRTNAVHILPGYEAPCKALLARESNGTETAISTRFDKSQPVGSNKAFVFGSYNIGLRCVRPN